MGCDRWILAPLPAIQGAAVRLRVPAPPLFEEEGHTLLNACVSDRARPFCVHGTCTGAALAPQNDPIDPAKGKGRDGAQERLERQKADSSGNAAQAKNTREIPLALDRHPHPDVRGPGESLTDGLQPGGT